MDILVRPPCWFVIVAIAVSGFQGLRGFYFQWLHIEQQNRSAALAPSAASSHVGKWARISMRCIPYAILYVLSTAAGFASLLGVTGQLPHLLQAGKFIPK